VVENRCLCCQKTKGNSFIVQNCFISLSLSSEEKEEEKEDEKEEKEDEKEEKEDEKEEKEDEKDEKDELEEELRKNKKSN
jgi:hypothetical protein